MYPPDKEWRQNSYMHLPTEKGLEEMSIDPTKVLLAGEEKNYRFMAVYATIIGVGLLLLWYFAVAQDRPLWLLTAATFLWGMSVIRVFGRLRRRVAALRQRTANRR
jgi:hypothetical protein